MKYIFIILFTIFPFIVISQPAKNGIDIMGDNEIDSGNIRIYYNFSQIDSTKKNDDKTYIRRDIQRLEVGNNLSKYYSYIIYHNDSITKAWSKKNPSAGSASRWMSSFPYQSWTEYIRSVYIKDFTTNQLTDYTQTALYIPDYQYTEDIPVQDWEIGDDTLTVTGYLCQKATCRFRGRDFTAWFTTDIPINNGPWKFGGLPGLIMKVYDSDKIFVFECTKIENQPYKIYLPDYSKYGKTTREKMLKLNKDMHEDWYRTAGVTFEGRELPPRSEHIYQPLELE